MHAPAPHDREWQILALWERGAGLGRWQRDDALLTANGVAPLALGVRNATLLALRGALFDRAWPLKSRCPACAADCEFEVDSLALAEELKALSATAQGTVVDCAGQPIELRAPTADDLRAVSALQDTGNAARSLLARCASGEPTLDGLDDRTVDELG